MILNRNRIRIEISLFLRKFEFLKNLLLILLNSKLAKNYRHKSRVRKPCADIHRQNYAAGGVFELPQVSVILPTYNHGKFLEEAIESVLLQEDVDLQLIIVNDGSTDNTEEVLKNYSNNAKIKIITQKNFGLPRAINSGLAIADGEFLTWTSADNILLPGCLSLLATMLSQNQELSLVYSDYQLVNEKGSPLLSSRYRVFDQDEFDSSRIHNCRDGSLFDRLPDNFIGPSFMFQKKHFDLIGNFSNLMGIEDYDYWLRLNTLGEIRHIYSQVVLYQYRIHSNTLSKNSRVLQTRRKLRTLVSEYW